MRAVARAATPTHLHLRERLVAIGIATLAIDVVASVVVFLFVCTTHGPTFRSHHDA